ncbi:universal stress protein [Lentzea sp. HUAS TT2]|uniref:universal stress protein n=1 Tax=Lentzea sp. HUAS TT2 TaxID=3447454 RepID=UPI003F720A06
MSDSEPKPVVVGVDGSPAARAALSWAADEARRRNRPLVVISAWYREPGVVIGPLPAEIGMRMTPERVEAAQRAVVDHAVKDITEVGLRTVVVHGDPRSELIDASADAELLVVGSRGHGPFVAAVLGSVSSYCVHHALCPVVVVKEARPRQEERNGDVVRPPLTPGPLL